MAIKAVIFDCFGVIRVDAMLIAYKKLGGDVVADGDLLRELIAKANAGLSTNGAGIIAERLGITEQKWRDTVQNSSVIDDEILDYAKELRNKYKTAMLSNIGQGGLARWFESGFLDKYFDVVVGSGDIGFVKPEARTYEITADKLEVRLDECVMIDDRQEYCEGAVAVGMKAIQYENLEKLKQDLNAVLVTGANN